MMQKTKEPQIIQCAYSFLWCGFGCYAYAIEKNVVFSEICKLQKQQILLLFEDRWLMHDFEMHEEIIFPKYVVSIKNT